MKIICSSMFNKNGAIRFYVYQGWTEELVKSCMVKGELQFIEHMAGNLDFRYWTPKAGAEFSLERLLEVADEVFRLSDDYPEETDREFLSRYLVTGII